MSSRDGRSGRPGRARQRGRGTPFVGMRARVRLRLRLWFERRRLVEGLELLLMLRRERKAWCCTSLAILSPGMPSGWDPDRARDLSPHCSHHLMEIARTIPLSTAAQWLLLYYIVVVVGSKNSLSRF